MCILKECYIGISSWIIFYSRLKVMSRFVILGYLSWYRIKIIPKPSNVERQLILLQRCSEERDIKGSRATFGVQVLSFTPCYTEQCHLKRPTWLSFSSRSSTSSAPGALQETSPLELSQCWERCWKLTPTSVWPPNKSLMTPGCKSPNSRSKQLKCSANTKKTKFAQSSNTIIKSKREIWERTHSWSRCWSQLRIPYSKTTLPKVWSWRLLTRRKVT